MQEEDTPSGREAFTTQDVPSLSRVGFRMAFIGSLLTLTALVLPDWRRSGLGPSLFQQAVETPPRTPNCVDTCGGGHLPGVVFFVGAWMVVLLLTTAFQVFLPDPRQTAGGVAVFVLVIGLIVFVPFLLLVVGQVVDPAVTFTYDQFGRAISHVPGVPDWDVLDSLVLMVGGGLLLVVVGAPLALVGAMRSNRR